MTRSPGWAKRIIPAGGYRNVKAGISCPSTVDSLDGARDEADVYSAVSNHWGIAGQWVTTTRELVDREIDRFSAGDQNSRHQNLWCTGRRGIVVEVDCFHGSDVVALGARQSLPDLLHLLL